MLVKKYKFLQNLNLFYIFNVNNIKKYQLWHQHQKQDTQKTLQTFKI